MKECADFGYEWNGGMGMLAMIARKWIPSDNGFWDSSNTIDARKSLGIGTIFDYVKFSMGLPIGTTLNAIDNKIFEEKYQALLKSMVDYYKANPNKLTVDIIRHCLKVFDSGGAEQEVQGSHVLSSTSQPIASTLQPISSSYFNYSPVKDVFLANPSLPTEIKTITTTITTPTVTTPTVTNTIQQISSTQKVEPEKKSGVSLPVVAGVGVLAYLMFSND